MSLTEKHLKPSNGVSYSPQEAYTDIHRLFLVIKLSHYVTKSYAAHQALGRIYDTVNELIDAITEQLIGYSGTDPEDLEIGTIGAQMPADLGSSIIATAQRLRKLGVSYPGIDNLAQDLSGAGAQLKYLSRFS